MPSVTDTTTSNVASVFAPIGGAGFAVRNIAKSGARNGIGVAMPYAATNDSAMTAASRNVLLAASGITIVSTRR
ncbi:hypothetical protein PAGU2638_13110 [Lysobacter sp. PAGU 2638]